MQLTAADAGCWVDGHWGWRASVRVIVLAREFGFQVDEELEDAIKYFNNDECSSYSDTPEIVYDASDEAEEWMNNNVAPQGYSFGWFDGEWFLWSYDTWEDETL